jgi:hypothetical protein
MLVWGAIAATSDASVTKRPAEAARAPSGDTYTTTGIEAPMMSLTMSRIDSSNPPGVSSRKTTMSAPSLCASSRLSSTQAAEAGLTVRSSSIEWINGPLSVCAGARATHPATKTSAVTNATIPSRALMS